MSQNINKIDQVVVPLKGERRKRRRERILAAFHDCIISQGYSKTTLRDVAEAADMSASHLLYYFPGKESLLEQYFEDVAHLIIDRIEQFDQETPDKQIKLLADLFFTSKGITRSEIGFMLECFGVAVHDADLKRDKTKLDRYCKEYLQNLFQQSPCDSSKVKDNAEVSYSLLIGLRTAAYFDQNLKLSHARDLFYGTVMQLAGYN